MNAQTNGAGERGTMRCSSRLAGREADGAAFARAHDRSRFRARCERRDDGVDVRGSEHHPTQLADQCHQPSRKKNTIPITPPTTPPIAMISIDWRGLSRRRPPHRRER